MLTKSDKLKLSHAVRRGVKFLDSYDPDWQDEIDIPDLDMSDDGYCILGHVMGGYADALDDLGKDESWAIDHGFQISYFQLQAPEPDGQAYSYLSERWIDHIKKRRNPHGTSGKEAAE